MMTNDNAIYAKTDIEGIVPEKQQKCRLQRLIRNDHVWTDDAIKAVEQGREIINQWMFHPDEK